MTPTRPAGPGGSKRIRVLIVEDEPLGQEKIQSLLSREPEVEVVGRAMTGPEAVLRIRELRPDLVFLDVKLPGCSGLEVLEQLEGDMPRAVIFITAYDDFAIQAFEMNAVDYLLKPLDRGRFKAALKKALARLGNQEFEELRQRLHSLLAQLPAKPEAGPQRLSFRESGRILFINLSDIDWVSSADNYVEIHAGTQKHLLRETMTSMERRLPGDTFVRISRTTLVNRHRIRELQPLFHGQYAVLLRDGTRLVLTRSHRDRLDRLGVA